MSLEIRDRAPVLAFFLTSLFLLASGEVAGANDFVAFESAPVRPLALSPDGRRLFAVNTPDARVEIFDVTRGGLAHRESIPVGLEPVAVAVLDAGEIWVVNHLSDSVSVVDVSAEPGRVVRTLLVGDEPRDIVFAGPGGRRAFVTTAHRGQNSPVHPQLTTPGVGRADVWVFDADALGSGLGGEPETVLTLFGDTPRALAASPDRRRVYAAVFRSGNGTTVIGPPASGAHDKAQPRESADGVEQPSTGLVLKLEGGRWVDDRGVAFDGSVPFSLPDHDIFEIDAFASTPRELRRFNRVGTILFDIAVHPLDGTLYVSNLESRNHIRFAGPATRASTSVRGRVADHRVTIVNGGNVVPRRLNTHLDFTRDFGTAAEREASLSMPLAIAISSDGSELYVAAFGSQKLAVIATAELEAGRFVPRADHAISLSAGGPSGVVLGRGGERAYVATRFDNGISVLDLGAGREIAHVRMFNPEPASVVNGRVFLYDARRTSGRGNDSCAACHLFGDTDALAWDLGDPDGRVEPIPNAFIPISRAASPVVFHPMKGPMATQSMRGLANHGPMHWRGDRTGVDRRAGETLEHAAFKEFNEAFVSLQGREQELSPAEMQSFTDFALKLVYPPNPIRNLDNSLTPEQRRGEELYNAGVVRQQTGQLEICVQCHPLEPAAGLFGTAGLMADNGQPGARNFKIPHFRDQYQKVGMFGFGFQDSSFKGPQVRGYGYNHNGATSTNFALADLGMPASDLAALRSFLFAFPTEMAPIVGQQISLRGDNSAVARPRLELLMSRARVSQPVAECDLIAKGVVEGRARGWLMQGDGSFQSDRASENAVSLADLLDFASRPGQAITFTCAPPGSGRRMGIDRNRDGVLDADR